MHVYYLIIIGTKQQRHKLSNHFPVKLLDNDITPSDSVRNLGVIFDSDFSFHKHVSNICKSCFYHIRDLRRIRRHVPLSTVKTISNALISSCLDYCNSLLNNIAKLDLSKRQRVQNCLARVVLRAPRLSPSLPLLKQLHWLPVNYRIQVKLSTLTYRALAIHKPPYLASLALFLHPQTTQIIKRHRSYIIIFVITEPCLTNRAYLRLIRQLFSEIQVEKPSTHCGSCYVLETLAYLISAALMSWKST